MAVSEHDEVEIGIRSQQLPGQRTESLGALVASRVLWSAKPAFRAADHANQASGPIRVELPKGGTCRSAADHGLEGPVTPVAPTQAIAMGNIGPQPSHLGLDGSVEELDAYFVSQESPAPRIVVSAEHPNPDPRIDEIRQDAKHGEVPTQDHGIILEPEIEQITVDQEIIGDIRYPGEERHYCGFVVRWSRSKVGVGDDDTGPFHAAKYRVPRTNVKRSGSIYYER